MRIDARGQRCPWPAIRAARALREGADAIEIWADDPAAPGELAAIAAAAGATLTRPDAGHLGEMRFEITRKINSSFTDRA
ncbi:sulfurtransferase TusA family protein [Sphingomonas sp.]|uniref:sulfurtransferase TusA family protein n=1 Tax=Sphingomonas sp. TaxID=28214 RepID=UPI001D3EF572|nr:sulfurtransferase TusA family protein [Sphingomonas sp.]MBX9795818.1 sulfurtransferase TusA family protein [Sphingomonas sp.]